MTRSPITPHVMTKVPIEDGRRRQTSSEATDVVADWRGALRVFFARKTRLKKNVDAHRMQSAFRKDVETKGTGTPYVRPNE